MSTEADIVERLDDVHAFIQPTYYHNWDWTTGAAIIEAAKAEITKLRAERDAAARENARLRTGLEQIVDMRNPATRAQVREACAEILAGGSAILATEGTDGGV